MTENFGSYLKAERELRGVPLEEISATTKIHIRFLKALEDNQFDDLPGDVFVKGYIRSIVKVIGSDENAMLNEYDKEKKKLTPSKIIENPSIENKNIPERKIILILGLAIVFFVGLGWGTKILIQKKPADVKISESETLESNLEITKSLASSTEISENNLSTSEKKITPLSSSSKITENPKNQTKSLSDKLNVEPAPSTENFSETLTKTNSGATDGMPNIISEKSVSNSSDPSDMPLELTIKARDNVWFNITVDGSRQEDFIFPKGTTKTFYGNGNFGISLGNRNVVELHLNGKALELPAGDINNMLQNFSITAQLIE